jgi:hypothetical protein
MKFSKIESDKGVAGLTILLSLVTFLFVIGLLIMIYSLMGGKILESDTVTKQFSDSATQNVVNITGGATLTACSGVPFGQISSVSSVVNDTDGGVWSSSDYTFSGCTVTNATALIDDNVNISYGYTYAGSDYSTINDTVVSISETTDWFSIFIVIGAMVVLILLTVIIITSIRGSGLMGSAVDGGSTIGSA